MMVCGNMGRQPLGEIFHPGLFGICMTDDDVAFVQTRLCRISNIFAGFPLIDVASDDNVDVRPTQCLDLGLPTRSSTEKATRRQLMLGLPTTCAALSRNFVFRNPASA